LSVVLRWEAPTNRDIPADLKQILDKTVKIFSYVKGRKMSPGFAELYVEIESYYTEERWFSRGKVPACCLICD
jgi:hypothetical protein